MNVVPAAKAHVLLLLAYPCYLRLHEDSASLLELRESFLLQHNATSVDLHLV